MGNTIIKGEKIKIPEPFHPIHKMTRLMDVLNKSGEQVSHFAGYETIQELFYIYLLKKYKNHCLLINSTTYLIIDINLVKKTISKAQKTIFATYAKQVCACIKKDVETIIMPFTLRFEDNTAHANIMIYRKKTNQIEHFEPHGGYYYGSDTHEREYNKLIHNNLMALVEQINHYLKRTENLITFIHSFEVCLFTDFALEGFQYMEEESSISKIVDIEGGGYCAAWSMFFVEMCLKNPKFSSKELLEILDQHFKQKKVAIGQAQVNDYLRKVIRGYVNFINEKLLKYFSIIYGEDITVENLITIIKLNDRVKIKKLNKIIDELIELDHSEFGLTLTAYEKIMKNNNADIKANNKKLKLEQRVAMMHLYTEYGKSLLLKKDQTQTQIEDQRLKYDGFKVSSASSEAEAEEEELEEGEEREVKKIIEKAIEKDSLKHPQIKVCPPGKELNPKTGRCINIKTKTQKIKAEKTCPPGKELNPLTGRCINIKTKTQKNIKIKAVKTCPPGKELNPLTGRCINTKKNK